MNKIFLLTALALQLNTIFSQDITVSVKKGKVIAVGNGLYTQSGYIIPMSVQEGDEVMIPAYGGQEIKLNKETYILFRESDLLAVFKNNTELELPF